MSACSYKIKPCYGRISVLQSLINIKENFDIQVEPCLPGTKMLFKE